MDWERILSPADKMDAARALAAQELAKMMPVELSDRRLWDEISGEAMAAYVRGGPRDRAKDKVQQGALHRRYFPKGSARATQQEVDLTYDKTRPDTMNPFVRWIKNLPR